ncbi:MAG: deoxyribodipyrimidine photo-lyase [Thiogranum sp.]|nr:deoxyribodipyrimidine photo-lyase [Thiogranum sp.]
MPCALVWFRNDLRLSDHPALHTAVAQGYTAVPVYIHDESTADTGAASRWWLHHSLHALQQDLQRLGSRLIILTGDSSAALLGAARDTGARTLFWNRRYDPAGTAQDQQVEAALAAAGIATQSFSAALLREPADFGKADGSPYRVFTPFWKALQKAGPPRVPLAAPATLPGIEKLPRRGVALKALGLLPASGWDRQFYTHWQPGESTAWNRLQAFLDDALLDYPQDRDRPALPGTSGLSPHLHFGEITPARIWHLAQAWAAGQSRSGAIAAVEAFLRQIAWRDFAHHLLFHFPHLRERPLDARYDAFPWATDYAAALAAWQHGETGIPVIDAGMRQLWRSGWMHNRVRMLCASLLTKNLLVPWQQGARWFADTLVDADVANNSFGWQWAAGCGADAAPWFRIFNPVTQGERFDGDGSYVRRWVPELQQLPAQWIHKPWQAPAPVLAAAGVTPGENYPLPIIDLAESRTRALDAWSQVKQQRR